MNESLAVPPLVPPLNFAMVAPGVYRSGYPNKRNYPFLKKLELKTILSLSRENSEFIELINAVKCIEIPFARNKEPFVEMDKEKVAEALKIILDKRNYPILVHCDKGKNRVGCIFAIIRKMQKVSLS